MCARNHAATRTAVCEKPQHTHVCCIMRGVLPPVFEFRTDAMGVVVMVHVVAEIRTALPLHVRGCLQYLRGMCVSPRSPLSFHENQFPKQKKILPHTCVQCRFGAELPKVAAGFAYLYEVIARAVFRMPPRVHHTGAPVPCIRLWVHLLPTSRPLPFP